MIENINSEINLDVIESELLEMVNHFGIFFARVGFKRIDGAIFGLLTFSKRPLRSEEIESLLGLSQSAVSQSLKTLTIYSMIETVDDKEQKRLKLHYIKEDAMAIVSSVIRKRELEYLREFEKMNLRSLDYIKEDKDDKRKNRINSILMTTRFAKTLAEFIAELTDKYENPYSVLEKIPTVFQMLKGNVDLIGQTKDKIQNQIIGKLGSFLTNSGQATNYNTDKSGERR